MSEPSKQPASNPYTVEDYATGFMCGLEDRGWTRLDRELEDDIREQVASLWEKLDVDGMETRIGWLERGVARVEGERDAALRRVAELERERDEARVHIVKLQRELDRVSSDRYTEWCGREKAEARIAELEAEVERLRKLVPAAWDAGRDYLWQTPRDPGNMSRDEACRAAMGKEAQP